MTRKSPLAYLPQLALLSLTLLLGTSFTAAELHRRETPSSSASIHLTPSTARVGRTWRGIDILVKFSPTDTEAPTEALVHYRPIYGTSSVSHTSFESGPPLGIERRQLEDAAGRQPPLEAHGFLSDLAFNTEYEVRVTLVYRYPLGQQGQSESSLPVPHQLPQQQEEQQQQGKSPVRHSISLTGRAKTEGINDADWRQTPEGQYYTELERAQRARKEREYQLFLICGGLLTLCYLFLLRFKVIQLAPMLYPVFNPLLFLLLIMALRWHFPLGCDKVSQETILFFLAMILFDGVRPLWWSEQYRFSRWFYVLSVAALLGALPFLPFGSAGNGTALMVHFFWLVASPVTFWWIWWVLISIYLCVRRLFGCDHHSRRGRKFEVSRKRARLNTLGVWMRAFKHTFWTCPLRVACRRVHLA